MLAWPAPQATIKALDQGERDGCCVYGFFAELRSGRSAESRMKGGLRKLADLLHQDHKVGKGVVILLAPLHILPLPLGKHVTHGPRLNI
jgi:hypothetical protein